jgi:hypothetical protein
MVYFLRCIQHFVKSHLKTETRLSEFAKKVDGGVKVKVHTEYILGQYEPK